MNDLRTAAQQALDALNLVSDEGASEFPGNIQGAISDLEAALAQEQAEPKPMHPELRKMWEEYFDRCFRAMPLPAQEQAEPLTDEEIDRITDQQWGAANGQKVLYAAFRTYARAIERAHGIGEQDER